VHREEWFYRKGREGLRKVRKDKKLHHQELKK
jgi:hypothetical protein